MILSKLSNHPEAAVISGTVGLSNSFLEWSTPLIQWLVLAGTLVVIILTIIGRIKNIKKK